MINSLTMVKSFPGFLIAGFECAGHRLRDGARFDLAAATEHDRYCDRDYARARVRGICTVRESARWHTAERSPWRYDFSSLRPIVRAARELDL